MEDIFITEFLNLDNKFKELGVFDSIINRDSPFFINLLRLKVNKTPEFQGSYERINSFYRKIMILLDSSKSKEDKLYRAALKLFHFPGVSGINLGVSETGIDAGFGSVLSKQVINDAFDIVKSGSEQPEIFQLVGLFEKNVSADRLSDMIATIILPDIRNYTIGINRKLNINTDKYPDIEFQGEIAINPYKKCELLYLPEEVLHEIPIAESWSDIDRVIQENQAIRDEVNEAVGKEWRKMCSADKKEYLKEHIFKNSERCGRMIENYRTQTIAPYEIESNAEYLVASTFKQIKREGIFDVLSHSAKRELSSLEATIEVLSIFRDWIENNRGWDEILSASTSKREKSLQRLLHLSGKYYCTQNNIDMAFEANEGPGPVDLKMSRGNDKTVVEIKLSSNADYIHGYEEQIEEYILKKRNDVVVFIRNIMDNVNYQDAYDELVERINKSLRFVTRIQDGLKKDVEKKKDSSLQMSDIFACDAFAGLDDIIIDWALEQLNDEILDAQIDGLNIAQIADQRMSKAYHYSERYKNEYTTIKYAYLMMKSVSLMEFSSDIKTLVANYQKESYLIDSYYRWFYYAYDQIEDNSKFSDVRQRVLDFDVLTELLDLLELPVFPDALPDLLLEDVVLLDEVPDE